ncbi:hypothetical protein M501DRAFT_997532 [Patellaria atrata CBS 101060]|uniref:Protein SDS23 n=1 Tax=Patellaria atrata CBS 101060 TaxID=1346257 RepID=A0A9P4S5W1_9PEZI|nr:hypothetical protein M501DRAFT_997532 [Patellaria atrata CBS 101060]
MAQRPTSEASEASGARPIPNLSNMSNTLPRSPPSSDSLSRTPNSPMIGHRQSYAENLRGVPPSPRHAPRQASLNQQALQELLNNPPASKDEDPRFIGRDWRGIHVEEIIDSTELKFAEMDMSVEDATEILINSGAPNVLLLRDSCESKTAIGTFDYSDLNAYLLLVVGLAKPDERHIQSFNELAARGREGKPIPLKDVKDLGKKEPLITLPHTASLTKAVEIFGSGVHRIIIVKEHSAEAIGILSQLRLVRFFWENGRHFPVIDELYAQTLRDLQIGSHRVWAINGDKPLTDALELLNNEGVTSLPVLDNQNNVIGNISTVDVRLLTKSTSLPLLRSSCIHFISVILSERGVHDGKDSFPVFHVSTFSTLAHTVGKLVATRSHRMWIVDSPSPSGSGPATPVSTPAVLVPPSPYAHSAPSAAPPFSATPSPSVSAAAMPGMSGHLSGVVSLTDILNLFARASGLSPLDPNETRRQRRRSSSSSVRKSIDSARSSDIEAGRRERR